MGVIDVQGTPLYQGRIGALKGMQVWAPCLLHPAPPSPSPTGRGHSSKFERLTGSCSTGPEEPPYAIHPRNAPRNGEGRSAGSQSQTPIWGASLGLHEFTHRDCLVTI